MALVYAQKNLTDDTTDAFESFVEVYVSNLASVAIQLAGTFAGTVEFEATVNGSDWVALTLTPSTGGAGAANATGTGVWQGDCGGYTKVRARCSTYTSGTIDASIGASVNTVVASVSASDGQVLFMSGTDPAGDSGLTWDKANNQLSLGIYPTTPSKIFVDYGILRQYGETSEANIDAPIAAYLQLGADATNSTVSVATTVQATLEPFGDNDLVDLTFYNTEPIDLGGSGVVTQLTGYRSGAGVDSLNSAHAIATYFSFRHSADVTGPGTIYAFYSAQNVGTNRWAFYGAGTAQNFFGGDTVIGNGKAIKTDTTTAHTAVLQAYDVDGAAYKTFATLTNANSPSLNISQPAGGILAIIPPSVDPHVVGAIWNNSGTLAISAG